MSTKDKALPLCSDESKLEGKGGVHYLKHGAFCLETQKFPDAVNHVMLHRRNSSFHFRSNGFSPSGKLPFNNLEPWYNLQAFSCLQVRSQCLIDNRLTSNKDSLQRRSVRFTSERGTIGVENRMRTERFSIRLGDVCMAQGFTYHREKGFHEKNSFTLCVVIFHAVISMLLA